MIKLEAYQYFHNLSFPFHIEIYRFQPSETVEPHSHDFVEMAYIAEGNGYHGYKNQEYQISEGDVFIIEPDQIHSYRSQPNQNLVIYNILFQPSLLQAEWETLEQVTPFIDFYYVEPFLRNTVSFQSHLKLNNSAQLEIKSLLNRLLIEYKEKQLGYPILCKTKLIEIFIFLSRCYENLKQPYQIAFDSDELRIRRIADFIYQHYEKPLSLIQVSRMCGMSQSNFSVKFKEYIGQTFIEYRNDIRIKAAITRLTETTDKVSQIALDVGFEDISFFNQLFKASTGLPPGKYRNKLKEEKYSRSEN